MKYKQDYTAYAGNVIAVYEALKDRPQGKETFINFVRHTIFDMAVVETNMVSDKVATRLKKDLTKDHFFSRKQTALLLLRLLETHKSLSIARLAAIIKSRCRVNLVSKEENHALRTFQNDKSIKTWRQEYKLAGITLIPYENKKRGRKPKQ